MVSRCANPGCGAPFRYMRGGKLFRVELDMIDGSPLSGNSGKPSHRVEHFWLCGRCAADLTLVCDRGKGIMTVPLARIPKAS